MEDSRGLQHEVERLQSAVTSLERRVAVLERPIPATSRPTMPLPAVSTTIPRPPTTTHTTSTTVPRVIFGIVGLLVMMFGVVSPLLPLLGLAMILLAVFWPNPKKATVASPTTATPAGTPSAPTPHVARRPSKFEEDLAKHWFSWVGIISIVVGITLLLNYAFRDYGALGRIFTGYAVSLMLFGLWAWLRKMYRGFAFVLQSGAWALLYISTFALHTISGQPVDSAVLAGGLLLVVVVLMCAAALIQHSRALTVGAFFLGYVTVFTNTLDTFVAISLLFLAAGSVVVSTKQRWPSLVTGAIVATYFVQFGWITMNIDAIRSGNTANIVAIVLFFDLLVFGAAHWLIGAKQKSEEWLTISGTILNLVGFYALFEVLVDLTHNPHGWVAPMFIGVVCAALAWTAATVTSRRYLRDVYIVFAIAFITLGLGQWCKGDTRVMVWLVEAGAVVSVGVLSRLVVTRIMGYLTSFVALVSLLNVLALAERPFGTLSVDRRLVLGIIAVVIFGGVAYMMRQLRTRALSAYERYLPEVFADVALVLALTVLKQQLPVGWAQFSWTVIAVIAWGMARLPAHTHRRLVGLAIMVVTIFSWLATIASSIDRAGFLPIHTRLVLGLWIVIVLGLGAILFRGRLTESSDRRLDVLLGWLAVTFLTIVLGIDIMNRWLSVAWGLEGVALYLLGFIGQNPSARRQALVVMGLTIAKVYLFDVQTLTTPYQILSFILLGCILLGVGYAFNRWRQRLKNPSST